MIKYPEGYTPPERAASEHHAAETVLPNYGNVKPLEDDVASLAATAEITAAKAEAERLLADPRLTKAGRRRVLRNLRKQQASKRRRLTRELREADREADAAKRQLALTRFHHAAYNELVEWAEKYGEWKLERANSSRLHLLLEAIDEHKLFCSDENVDLAAFWAKAYLPHAQAIVVQHDWAGAFGKSEPVTGSFEGGDFRLPANPSAFEFDYSARRIIALMGSEDDGQSVSGAVFVETKSGWIFDGGSVTEWGGGHMPCDLATQIAAMCVALDSEIAETETVRAPYRLNRARERRGKLPISDYHVVNLARQRSRAPTLDDPANERRSPRLHFRRGHWRHYEQHKTWINWTLVGDPELGFIDKEYRL